jgi:RNA polymerase sigma factor (sigma-70 family)
MPEPEGETAKLLDQLKIGNKESHNKLLIYASERLLSLTKKMLGDFPALKRWEQTDDVFQNAMIRLHRALSDLIPDSARHFWNLAALQIRRELQNLAQHYQGPQGIGANHHSDGAGRAADDQGAPLQTCSDATGEPTSLVQWNEFHEKVQALPNEEREVFGLLWYDELTQEEAARVMGVSLRTVKRQWLSARRLLAKSLPDEPRQ